ncbi:MAG: hypothetical protein, partial [Olavius algarvensis Gamma 1 endosymbiont]
GTTNQHECTRIDTNQDSSFIRGLHGFSQIILVFIGANLRNLRIEL